jgi:5-formaminoimidazole-4-carboxamide-1-beta-D-ribofuranosyl 5'-monophosphate synthetase
MMAELVQDVKTELRELPWFAAMVVLAVAAGIGFNAAIFCEADGDEFRITANCAQVIEDHVSKLRAHSCSTDPKPGFTVVVGLRQYSVEFSVPVSGVRSLLDDAMHRNVEERTA